MTSANGCLAMPLANKCMALMLFESRTGVVSILIAGSAFVIGHFMAYVCARWALPNGMSATPLRDCHLKRLLIGRVDNSQIALSHSLLNSCALLTTSRFISHFSDPWIMQRL